VRKDKKWIWQYQAYPHFEYDLKKLDKLIESVSRKQDELMVLSKVNKSRNFTTKPTQCH